MPVTSAARPIISRLEQAAVKSVRPDQALFALAHLDPGDAAACLLAEEEAVRAACPGEVLSRLLAAIVEAGLARGSPSLSLPLVTLLRRFLDAIPPRSAAAVVSAIPEAKRDSELRTLVSRILKRVPKDATLLRAASEMAVSAGDALEAHRLLTRLALADDSQATVHYVHRTRARLPAEDGRRVRAALLSSFTVDPLVPYIDLELRSLGLVPEIYLAPYNSWAQEIIAGDTGLRRFNPEIAFLAVSIDDLVPELAGNPPAPLLDEKGSAAVDQVLAVAQRFAAWSDAPLVVHSFYSAYRDPLGVLEGRLAPARTRWLENLNARLSEGLRALPRAYLLEMNDLLLRRRGGPLDNPKARYLARMRLGERMLGEVARAYAGYIAPFKGLTRKCVVVDLDNTLWGGTIGEDGPHGITLGNTSPGVEYQDFQRYLLSLTERGFLLAINSKNNADDALEVIRSHEGMILREEAFSAIRINWQPKTENMESIAEELNIGVDSMVFLDDNPHERELMRQILPGVLTPDLPADPSLYRQVVESLPHLQSLVVTEEDRSRVQQYRSKRERETLRAQTQSIEDYFHSLEIEVEIGPVSDATLPRVHQLFERTNQFNLTARRYDKGQLAAFGRDPGWRLYTLRARDRFGDHGLVATALVHAEVTRWTLDSFLLSCRVIGYGVETALLAAVSEDAAAAGATTLVGEYVATRKNMPARDVYSRHGFTDESAADGVTRWRRELADGTVARPAWITVVRADGT